MTHTSSRAGQFDMINSGRKWPTCSIQTCTPYEAPVKRSFSDSLLIAIFLSAPSIALAYDSHEPGTSNLAPLPTQVAPSRAHESMPAAKLNPECVEYEWCIIRCVEDGWEYSYCSFDCAMIYPDC